MPLQKQGKQINFCRVPLIVLACASFMPRNPWIELNKNEKWVLTGERAARNHMILGNKISRFARTEMLEEGISNVAGNVADQVIMGELSNYSLLVQQFMQ